jgi:hypothetical protein
MRGLGAETERETEYTGSEDDSKPHGLVMNKPLSGRVPRPG